MEIDKQVKLLINPMAKRAVDHDLRLLDCVANIKRVLMVGSSVMVATVSNLDNVNRSLGLVLSAIQEVEDRCTLDKAKHLVAQKSSYGWKFVSSLESLEKKVGGIEISTLRAQEKAYATHVAAVGGDSKWSDNDWLADPKVNIFYSNICVNVGEKLRNYNCANFDYCFSHFDN